MRSTVRAMIAVALLAALGVVAGCASSGGADPAQLEGQWVLEAFGGGEALQPADPSVSTTLSMKAGESSGSGGVNSFSGSYEAKDDGSIKFGPQASTMMAGEPAAMEQEAQFYKALEDARNFEFNEGKLVFSDGGNNTLMVLAPQ